MHIVTKKKKISSNKGRQQERSKGTITKTANQVENK